ncbi:MAG: hypothetical protein OEU90_13200 [Gammaproteobacteria bacterium]|nr:hypothetical protein [Gammaproteobacteria bacterium]MDH3749854.1 hypothetical protein [Gammaproteobacteria bacterium]MDH3806412.1 hypothetical protein [Gammaproteobacteria bacterium]
MAIFKEQLQLVFSPRTAITELASNARGAFVGFKHIFILAVLYELAFVLWALGDATVTMPAFLKIPEDRYYFYELIFAIPVFFIVWFVASGTAYLLSKAIGGNGSYDTMLGGFGIAALISAYFTLIPDFIQGVLWTTGWVPFAEYQEATSRGPLLVLVWVYIVAYNVSHLVLYTVTIRYSQNLGILKSAIVAIISYFTSIGIFITFIR